MYPPYSLFHLHPPPPPQDLLDFNLISFKHQAGIFALSLYSFISPVCHFIS